MKKVFTWFIPVLIVLISLLAVNQTDVANAATKYKDGEYDVPFTILKGDSDEKSMTNDYVTTPAKLIVKDGKNTIQITIKNSSWWQYFKLDGADGTVISKNEEADTEVVEFTVADLEQTVQSNIHVIVPDIDYDNKYDIRFNFDTSNVPTASGADAGSTPTSGEETTDKAGQQSGNNTTNDTGGKEVEKNPPTGDDAPIVLLALMLVGSGIFLVRKFATQ